MRAVAAVTASENASIPPNHIDGASYYSSNVNMKPSTPEDSPRRTRSFSFKAMSIDEACKVACLLGRAINRVCVLQ